LSYILDSSAVIAYLWKEEGFSLVKSIVMDKNNKCFIHALNFCEVYYDLIRRVGAYRAKEITKKVSKGLIIRYDIDDDFWQQSGQYKADLHRISLADCFCISLAQRMQATILTADHHEFDKIEKHGIVSIKFIR